jgi:antitoxin CptB
MTCGDDSIDDLGVRRRRALYRASHRGTKEMDFTLGRFAQARVAAMSAARLDAFEELLALEDPLLSELLGGAPGAGAEQAALLDDLRAFHGLKAPPPASGRR